MSTIVGPQEQAQLPLLVSSFIPHFLFPPTHFPLLLIRSFVTSLICHHTGRTHTHTHWCLVIQNAHCPDRATDRGMNETARATLWCEGSWWASDSVKRPEYINKLDILQELGLFFHGRASGHKEGNETNQKQLLSLTPGWVKNVSMSLKIKHKHTFQPHASPFRTKKFLWF